MADFLPWFLESYFWKVRRTSGGESFYFRVLVGYNKGKGALEIWGWLEGVPTQRGRSSISVGEKNLCILFGKKKYLCALDKKDFSECMKERKRLMDGQWGKGCQPREIPCKYALELKTVPLIWDIITKLFCKSYREGMDSTIDEPPVQQLGNLGYDTLLQVRFPFWLW